MKAFQILSDTHRERVLCISCNLKIAGMFNELLSGDYNVREEVAKLISAEGIKVVNLENFLRLEDNQASWEIDCGCVNVYKTYSTVKSIKLL